MTEAAGQAGAPEAAGAATTAGVAGTVWVEDVDCSLARQLYKAVAAAALGLERSPGPSTGKLISLTLSEPEPDWWMQPGRFGSEQLEDLSDSSGSLPFVLKSF
ncbi:Hypothetical protein SMAX5B_019530 [Scophthalmus maximus]|uniref:Uncharacterized protein n=1 Tax=Scophthalmus maximus TaxID=52904 RepID=A0A2U9C198_SCOMX|nr:Hypothetical protein SMAX5B_019530 [Scophthalmus maximus]